MKKELCRLLAEWGNLVFFDAQERLIPKESRRLITIPKLETQWKVMYDVKPTKPVQLEKYHPSLGITVGRDVLAQWRCLCFVDATLTPPQIVLAENLSGAESSLSVATGSQVPKVGEWTRIEIGHEEENGKYFLSLAVGGEHVGRGEVTDPALKNPTDVELKIGCHGGDFQSLSGFVRRVVVVHK